MTQPEDDAARLARELIYLDDAMSLEPELLGKFRDMMEAEYVKLCVERETKEVDGLMVATAFHRLINGPAMQIAKLRAHLAERDARERMVREQLDKAVADIMAEIAESKHAYVKVAKTQQPFWEGRTRGCELALIHLRPLRAALSAKSDEPTPTPTEPSQ